MRYGYFGEGAAAGDPYVSAGDPQEAANALGPSWAANWNQPTARSMVDTNGDQIPYYLAPNQQGSGAGGDDPYGVGADGVPYYLRAVGGGLPSWVVPVAIGAAAVVVLGALGVVSVGKRR